METKKEATDEKKITLPAKRIWLRIYKEIIYINKRGNKAQKIREVET